MKAENMEGWTPTNEPGKKFTRVKYYIGRRDNPQLSKPYYKAYGQLTKKEAKAKEECSYGSMILESFDTIEECGKRLDELRANGFSIR